MNPKVFSPLFALLIFAAHLNCVLEHRLDNALSGDAVIANAVDFVGTDSLPVESEHCGHGCICEGAILADEVVIDFTSQSQLQDFFASLSFGEFSTPKMRFESEPQPPPFDCEPLLPLERCALLQTYLI